MSDRRIDLDLETRLERAFRSADLPAAPGRLLDALERVPDAPVLVGGASGARSGGARRATWGILGVAAILLVGGAVALSAGSRRPTPSPIGPSGQPGTTLSYQLAWTAQLPFSASGLAEEVRIVRARIDATGAVGIAVRTEGNDRLVVDLPAGIDTDALRNLIGQRGEVAFIPLGDAEMTKGDVVDEAVHPRLFGHEGLAGASIGTNGQTNQRVVTFQLTPAAATRFDAYTKAHIGQYFAIVLDGKVISAPTIQSEIPGGQVEISQNGVVGGFPLDEANELVAFLQTGPLPAPLRELSSEPGPVDPSASPDIGPSPSALVLASEPAAVQP
jgi:preprotein translocase subunit SecD